jgi:hypothetical protein
LLGYIRWKCPVSALIAFDANALLFNNAVSCLTTMALHQQSSPYLVVIPLFLLLFKNVNFVLLQAPFYSPRLYRVSLLRVSFCMLHLQQIKQGLRRNAGVRSGYIPAPQM